MAYMSIFMVNLRWNGGFASFGQTQKTGLSSRPVSRHSQADQDNGSTDYVGGRIIMFDGG
jgi:hypothetical protein